MTRNPLDLEIRKLRKKLRQIENLEKTERDLSDEELLKISRKNSLRSKLQSLLLLVQEKDETENEYSTIGDSFEVSLESTLSTSNTDFSFDTSHNESVVEEESSQSENKKSFEFKEQQPENNTINESTRKCPKRPLIDKTVEENLKKEPVKKSRAEPVKEQVSKPQTAKKRFRDKVFAVQCCEGHSDLVTSVDCDGQCMISGSRDTTLKYWDVSSGREIRSFGGHTGTVTSVVLLDRVSTQHFCEKYDGDTDLPFDDSDRIAFTGSTDCSIKIWALVSAQQLKSIYTFNPITCLIYLTEHQLLVTSTAGGKIDFWDPFTGTNTFSSNPHQDSITSLKLENGLIFSGSIDGEIQVSQYSNGALRRLNVSDVTKLKSGGATLQRPIRSLAVHNQTIYYGDDGSNVKVLDWKTGAVSKLSNHLCEFGSTDAATVFEGHLYTTGYDLDHGLGYINCRSVSNGQYMGTLCDEVSGCLLCVSCARNQSGKLTVVTGGSHLNIWTERDGIGAGESKGLTQTFYIKQYEKPAKHSDVESESDSGASDSGDESYTDNSGLGASPFKRHTEDQDEGDASSSSWMSWCTVL